MSIIKNINKEDIEGIIEKIITIKEHKFVTCKIKEPNEIIIIYDNNIQKTINLNDYILNIIEELNKFY